MESGSNATNEGIVDGASSLGIDGLSKRHGGNHGMRPGETREHNHTCGDSPDTSNECRRPAVTGENYWDALLSEVSIPSSPIEPLTLVG